MLKRNKVISMILAAQLAFNFYSGDVIARADESSTQEKSLSEQNENLDVSGELDQDLQEEVDCKDNVVYENEDLSASNEIDEELKEEINEEENESKEDSKEQIEVKDEEEVYYDEVQLLNSDSDNEVIWGEDINYNWDNKPYTTIKTCTINDVTFTMNYNDNTTVYISECNENKSGKLILPSKIKVGEEYYSVTSIEGAFSCCSKLTEVEIPDSVKSIGWNSFALCTSLKEISIPDSVISMGDTAFQRCRNLSKVKLSKNIKSIGSGAFSSCNISNIEIPNGVTSIGNGAFSYCSKLKYVTIPDSVTSIDGYAFSNCYSLSDITIPNSVTTLGDYVFGECGKLSNIKIPSSVTNIGFQAFYKTTGLKNIYVDENNKKYCDIDGVLFNKDKTELVSYPIGKIENSYSIPKSVTTINSSAFNYCSNLNAISIPDSVTSVYRYMFEKCSNLKSVWGSNNLKDELYFNSEDTSLIESNLYNRENYKDDVIKIKADSVKCFEVLNDGNKVEIPMTMNSEGYFVHDPSKSVAGTRNYIYEAVKDGTTYTSPVISVTVNEEDVINTWDYNLCTKNNVTYEKTSDNTACIKSCDSSLKGELVLPSKITVNNVEYDVTEIKEDALKNCNGVTALNIQVPLTNLSVDLISGCTSLAKLIIPSSITNIDDKVCDLLENITVAEDNTVYSSEDGVLFNKDKSMIIKYPKNKTNSSYVVPDSVKEISANAFKDNKNLSTILIKDNVETIDETAFNGCDNLVFSVNSEEMKLKLINIGIEEDKIISYEWDNENKCVINGVIYSKNEDDTVSIIGYNKDTLNSKTILLGKMIVGGTLYNVTTINENAFTNCDVLEEVIIEDGIQHIGAWAFSACTNLRKVYVSDSVISLDVGAFTLCRSLKDIRLSDGLERICLLTFNGCEPLEKIEIPKSVKVIEEGAFINCKNLKVVKISSLDIKEIQKSAFMEFNDDEMFYAKNKEVEILLNNSGVSSSRILTEEWNEDNQCCIDDIKYEKKDDNTVSIIGHTPFLNNKVNLNSKINVNGNKYTVTSIDYNAFTNSDIESVVIPDSITTIGEWAFSECKSLKEINIPDSVTTIGTGAFALCENLNEIVIPDSVKKICSFTFNGCTSLKGIAISDEVKTIEQYAFINCSSLMGIKIPSGIEEIQPGAFTNFNDKMIFWVENKNIETLLNNAGVDSKNIINYGVTVIVTFN